MSLSGGYVNILMCVPSGEIRSSNILNLWAVVSELDPRSGSYVEKELPIGARSKEYSPTIWCLEHGGYGREYIMSWAFLLSPIKD
jgi:hypothetical protein